MEVQNLKWIEEHPDSLLTAMTNVWRAFGSRLETVCLLTVAAFLNLEDYSVHSWTELSRNSAIQMLFDGQISTVVVEFYPEETSREECEYPDHAILFSREGFQVWKVESWFMKMKPTKEEMTDTEQVYSRIQKIEQSGQSYFTYYLTREEI
jgi:hypothetical protein